MKKIIEIRWHGRGGQGVVTASKLLAAAALYEDFYIQTFPEYGAERMGAPVQSFNRMSDEVINVHCQITEPDIVIVMDYTLLDTIDVTRGIKKEGIIIINTSKEVDEIKKILNYKNDKNINIYSLDAAKISLEVLGKVMPNTAMIGALLKATNLIKLDTLITAIKKTLIKKIPKSMVESNILSAKRAYKELRASAKA